MTGKELEALGVVLPVRAGEKIAGNMFSRDTMEEFAYELSNYPKFDRPVVDKTGIKGTYLIALRWYADGDITTAMQELLGLRLEAQKAPAEVLVIDRIERPSGELITAAGVMRRSRGSRAGITRLSPRVRSPAEIDMILTCCGFIALLIIIPGVAWSQKFEVAAIKPASGCVGGRGGGLGGRGGSTGGGSSPGRLNLNCKTVIQTSSSRHAQFLCDWPLHVRASSSNRGRSGLDPFRHLHDRGESGWYCN